MAHSTIMAPPFTRHVRAPEALAADDIRLLAFALLEMLHCARLGLFRQIARACRAFDAPLLLTDCNGLNVAQAAALRQAGVTWLRTVGPTEAALVSTAPCPLFFIPEKEPTYAAPTAAAAQAARWQHA